MPSPGRSEYIFPAHTACTGVDGCQTAWRFLKRLPSCLAETALGQWTSGTGMLGLILCLEQGAGPETQGGQSQPCLALKHFFILHDTRFSEFRLQGA